MSEEKKPFKDTGLGKILLGVLPGIVKGASKVLPDSGVLGVIKNLIDTDPDMSADEKAAAHDQLVELYRLEVADRDSARKREASIIASGDKTPVPLPINPSDIAPITLPDSSTSPAALALLKNSLFFLLDKLPLSSNKVE